ncbi:uncharacterized protein P174DRAFT_428059 [Aspergillus novofumigatus IBT 16806]|uniref:Uncharacterized protein n=1 Tax=Aspergillus novofumigatus (strain IBT 16806) TaxID=1392255 RepID=A0A2I1CFV8_ASPN1|nr:uncharacterized protein P174DRAFT_428059 [Aspergillus novofumigatus IBT 16806]PKX96516.1 hypothetical protein P174DRAFT_428059 [Aspergillus novofumigatus IBT 16806]
MANFKKMTLALASLAPSVIASAGPTKMTVGVIGARVDMYPGAVFDTATWYQCLGNHDAVKGQSGVDFETKGQPYYTYDLHAADWTATFVVVDSDCFIEKYQASTSVYQNSYTKQCHAERAHAGRLPGEQAFAASKAEWGIPPASPRVHVRSDEQHRRRASDRRRREARAASSSTNGHYHCLAHVYNNNTNFILAGGAGYPQAGDCNYGVPLGPYTKWLGANSQSAANGFVAMDISREEVNVEYYARDMKLEGGDLYPVKNDMAPSYSFKIKTHAP